jgi:hypothetical protein
MESRKNTSAKKALRLFKDIIRKDYPEELVSAEEVDEEEEDEGVEKKKTFSGM